MGSVDDIVKGFAAFNQGLRNLTVAGAVATATKRVGQINATFKEGAEREQATNELARDFALRLTGRGIGKAQVESVITGITGDRVSPDITAQIKSKERIAAAEGKELDPLSDKLLTQLGETDKFLVSAIKLFKTVEKNPNFVGPVVGRGGEARAFLDPEFGAFKADVGLNFQKLRKITTGAQATIKELEQLEKLAPNMTDTAATFKAKLRSNLSLHITLLKKNIARLKGAGRDTQFFEQTQLQMEQTLQQIGVSTVDFGDPGTTTTPSEQFIDEFEKAIK